MKGYLLSTARLILALALSASIIGCGDFFKKWPKEEIPKHIKEILSSYHIPATVRIHGHTLWVYCPITKLISPAKDQRGPRRHNKQIVEIVNDVLFTIGRVLWNSHSEDIKFYGAVFANTSLGLVLYVVGYTQDLRDLYLGKISIDRFSQRRIIDRTVYPSIIGDETGENFHYFDISMVKFLCQLVVYRLQQDHPDLYLNWADKKTSTGNYICTFLLNSEDPETISEVKRTIKEVFQTYDFKRIQYVSLQTPSREIILTPEDLFGKEGSPKGDKTKR